MFTLLTLALFFQASACQQGVALLERGNPAAARRLLEPVWKQEGCAKTMGVALAALGDYRAAEEPFAAACRKNPAERDACYYWARTLYALDRFDDSLKALAQAASGATKLWVMGTARGQALDALGRREAEPELGKALAQRRLDPAPVTEPDPLLSLALFLYRQGRGGEALTLLRTAPPAYQQIAAYHYQLGRALAQGERWEEAAAALRAAVLARPEYPEAHGLLSRCYYRLGNNELGAAHTDKARNQGSATAK